MWDLISQVNYVDIYVIYLCLKKPVKQLSVLLPACSYSVCALYMLSFNLIYLEGVLYCWILLLI
jgi:hypothetical protein